MASNIYLAIDGIKGESTVEKYKDQIEIMNFSYSCFQPVSESRSGGIHTCGRANHGTVNFSKFTDIATADILAAMWAGKTIKDATIRAVTNNNNDVIEYMTIVLTNVVFSNFSIHGGGNSVASEEISLSYSKIKVEYHNQGENGTTPGKKPAEWDLSLEKKP
jgi:type VI secretion system secreted protein Hcp